MKKTTYFVVMAVVLLAAFVLAVDNYQTARIAGSGTVAGGWYHMEVDSTDSNPSATFYSDTIEVDPDKDIFAIMLARDTCVLADSSISATCTVLVNVWTGYTGGSNARIIATKTMDGDIVGDTTFINLYIKPTANFSVDSLVYRYVWFETVLSDSVLMDDAGAGDTVSYQGLYHVLQR